MTSGPPDFSPAACCVGCPDSADPSGIRPVAPGEPRWKFASEPTLCKLYVIRETGGDAVDPESDPCNDFLKVFLPQLDRLVFSKPE